MSYDRVLPKPAGFYYDFSGRDIAIRSNTPWNSFTTSILDRDALIPPRHQFPAHFEPSAVGSAPEIYSRKPVTNLAAILAPPVSRPQFSSIAFPEVAREQRATSASSSKSTSSRDSTGGPFCLCKPDPKIPRPRNAFILFRQHYQAAVVEQNPGLANPEISKIIGEKWRSLPAESKQDWKNLAEDEKVRHQQQYPDYRYQPRRYGRKGNGATASGLGISNNPTGPSSCMKCGGRLMNPPSTPTSPFISAIRTHDDANISSGTSRVFSSGMNGRAFGKHTGSVSPRHLIPRPDWVSGEPARNSDENGYLAPETKRRRCSFFPVRRDLSPVCGYAPHQPPFAIERPSMQSKVPCGIDPFQSSRIGNPGRPDPSLVLPPLQTPSQTQGINMIMAVPFLNKIKELAEISPPFTTTDSALASQGLVIAVEGQNPGSVQCVLRHLENVFASRPGNDVRVFHGPELHSSRPSTAKDPRDTTMQHLKTMSTWHRISKDILNFVSNSSEHPATDQGFSTELTSKPSAPHTAPTISTVADSTFRVALVPQYQLSTADAHACATPINDAYAPIDHWRWTATPLWRGCVGPDITIYVRDCDKEELSRFGEGNPVENRLGDARTLIVRRAVGSPDSIEEKALRRMGFEVVEFLGR